MLCPGEEIKIVFPIATDLKIFTIALPTGQDFDGGFIILIRDVTEEKLIEQSKRDFYFDCSTPTAHTTFNCEVVSFRAS